MNILITGANGFLGQHLSVYFSTRPGYDVVASGRGERRIQSPKVESYIHADLTFPAEVRELIEYATPDVIIHTAAMSKPVECHENHSAAKLHNIKSTRILLSAALQYNPDVHFIFTSTDFIFGEGGPHSEDDHPDPLNYYGSCKLKAEELLKTSNCFYTIVRPVFIYGQVWPGMRPDFLHWIRNSLEVQKPIKVVADQWRTPTFAIDICKGIESIIQLRKSGVYHLAGKDILSPYQMATTVAGVLSLNYGLIESVTAETFPEPVVRARRSGLKIDKAIRELNYQPVSFEEGVRQTFGL